MAKMWITRENQWRGDICTLRRLADEQAQRDALLNPSPYINEVSKIYRGITAAPESPIKALLRFNDIRYYVDENEQNASAPVDETGREWFGGGDVDSTTFTVAPSHTATFDVSRIDGYGGYFGRITAAVDGTYTGIPIYANIVVTGAGVNNGTYVVTANSGKVLDCYDPQNSVLNGTDGTRDTVVITPLEIADRVCPAGDAGIEGVFGGGLARVRGNNNMSLTGLSDDFNIGTGDFTIHSWHYVPTGYEPGWGDFFVIFKLNNDPAYTIDGYLNGYGGGFTIPSNIVYPYDEWFHVAFVRYRGDLKIYLNGELKGQGSFPDAINLNLEYQGPNFPGAVLQ
jgi:hypothetical protein